MMVKKLRWFVYLSFERLGEWFPWSLPIIILWIIVGSPLFIICIIDEMVDDSQ